MLDIFHKVFHLKCYLSNTRCRNTIGKLFHSLRTITYDLTKDTLIGKYTDTANVFKIGTTLHLIDREDDRRAMGDVRFIKRFEKGRDF